MKEFVHDIAIHQPYSQNRGFVHIKMYSIRQGQKMLSTKHFCTRIWTRIKRSKKKIVVNNRLTKKVDGVEGARASMERCRLYRVEKTVKRFWKKGGLPVHCGPVKRRSKGGWIGVSWLNRIKPLDIGTPSRPALQSRALTLASDPYHELTYWQY